MYIATFYTHYGAQSFYRRQKKVDSAAEIMPVPRALSASCGICVSFSLNNTDAIKREQPEDMEGLYLYDDGKYAVIFEIEE